MSERIILANPPVGLLNLNYGEPTSTFELEKNLPVEIPEGHVLVKVKYLSNDPTQRTWIRAGQNPKRVYRAPVEKGAVVDSLGLGEVVDSKSLKYKKGDMVVGILGWANEIVVNESAILNTIDNSSGLPLTIYLSSLGLTGLTAYLGLTKVGEIKEGQSVLISAASGATGSMAVQLAKHVFKASKVYGIAGSDEKCRWVESLGADYCANYRDTDWKERLHERLGDNLVDLYFDNVGGEILDFALSHVKQWGCIVACGSISGYNDPAKAAVSKWGEIIPNRLTVKGFIAFDFRDEIPEATSEITRAVMEGKIKTTEGVSLIDISGQSLAAVPRIWNRLFTDEKPMGKLITKIA